MELRGDTAALRALELAALDASNRALQTQIWHDAFEETRRKLVPKARARGIYSDEDVFKLVS